MDPLIPFMIGYAAGKEEEADDSYSFTDMFCVTPYMRSVIKKRKEDALPKCWICTKIEKRHKWYTHKFKTLVPSVK